MMFYTHERKTKTTKPFNTVMPPSFNWGWDIMKEYLEKRGLNHALAVDSGWYPSIKAGDNRLRVVIPATATPPNVYWQARDLQTDDEPRYQSPSAPRGDAVIVVGNPQEPYAFVVEGPMDALAAGEMGLGVAMMGAMPSEEALGLTAKLVRGKMVFVVADRDASFGAVRTLTFLCQAGLQAALLFPPSPFKDLAAMYRKERLEYLKEVRRSYEAVPAV